jgi:hypothetical protein
MSLESALVDLEKQLEAAAKAAKAALATLKKAQTSARFGTLRDLQKQLADARVSAARFADIMAAADQSWTFAPEPYFAGGGYLDELKQEAERAGLSLFEKDGRLYCFPMLLMLSDKDSAVVIDRKLERRVRPSELVKLLAARQKRPQRANAQKFLEMLFDAYVVLAPQVSKDWSSSSCGLGPVVQFVKIYDLLTLLPGSERDYTKDEFARDIHILDQQPDLRTRDGRRFALPASTGSKAVGKRLTMIDPTGTERIYVGVRFDKE